MAEKKRYDVISAGLLLTDVLAQPLRTLPEPGLLSLVDTIKLHTGGCALNTGIALARLGVRVGLVGLVGEDGFGDFVIQSIQREGADPVGVRRVSEAGTSATVVLINPEGERSFIHTLGANALFSAKDVDLELAASARIFHVGSVGLLPAFDGEPMATVLQQVRSHGVITSLDTVWDPFGRWLKVVEPCLPHVDLFTPALHEARMITGLEEPEANARFFLERGARVVAVKMGAEGCFVADREHAFHVPGYTVDVVDTTGAGDSFVAGFLVGWLQGWPLEKIARFANAVGALCVTAVGATAGVRSFDETLRFVQEHAP